MTGNHSGGTGFQAGADDDGNPLDDKKMRLRNLFLPLLSLFSSSAAAPQGDERVVSGYYTLGWEEQSFQPCGERAYGPDGQPLRASPVRESEVMTPEECARQIVAAAAARRRELIMTMRGKVGAWIKLVAPGVVDRIARRAIEQGR